MTFVSRRDRRRQAKPSLAKAVASNAGTVGRGAAAAVAASGLVISSGVAANASTDIDTPEVTTLDVAATGLSVERASSTSAVAVSASTEVELSFERSVVTSTPAPEPAPEPAPVVEEVEEVVPAAPEVEPAPAPQPEPVQQAVPAQLETPAPQAEPEPQPEPEPAPQQQTQQADAGQQAQGNTQVASAAPAQEEAPASSGGGNGSVVGAAYAGLGNPYSFGGTSPSGWDCSGFINWAYGQAGISVPRSTYAMMGSLRQVSSPSPGDIVIQNGGSHAAIYVGNGQLIGASNPRVGTIQYPLNSPYWSNTMYLSVN
ncbi:C40 family peptidase [Nesterenkonia sandarakina]|uniref:Cell wall-associated NlpC family hydrolase n=1 Tax=Nesterenkonia sandarakina TaxID=272918 RepID=A0A2T0YFL8_9MICC|nr:C40 family peptidase [Nesterenkonia sandarakina]PRZ13715.1 cell wall-associated NlpC family hydrolase [Nesterenkonia sandarakina]